MQKKKLRWNHHWKPKKNRSQGNFFFLAFILKTFFFYFLDSLAYSDHQFVSDFSCKMYLKPLDFDYVWKNIMFHYKKLLKRNHWTYLQICRKKASLNTESQETQITFIKKRGKFFLGFFSSKFLGYFLVSFANPIKNLFRIFLLRYI